MADIRPTLSDLGGIMRARTRDVDGSELGTFTADTRPTATEAAALVDRALAIVNPRLGVVPDALAETAKSVVALRAAMFVEAAYFPEENDSEGSPYANYRDAYVEALGGYDLALQGDVVKSAKHGTLRTPTLLSAFSADPTIPL